MNIHEYNCSEFIEVLASKAPVPGGGGAAALCGAVGTALGNMVGSLTVGKKKYADVEAEILTMKEKCSRLQSELLELANQDAEVFEPLSQAYALPTGTEEQKQFKAARLEECSKAACQVPLEIMQKCCEAIELVETFAQKGSRLAVSDAGCGASILKGALQAASLNIFINTKGMNDRVFADRINRQANEMLQAYGARADQVFAAVRDSLES
ncbi:MAG: cyclodeaminase/cyclohydrolase family protein [Parasporobacterium sp.]|nr:cyclodeaminase/cyclohydrolase family protein [Parasporobacterium sp.]